MERSQELLELLNTLIISVEDNIVILHKDIFQSMVNCLQVMEAKVILLQYQSQLLNDDLIVLKNQQLVKCSELVFAQNNPLYDDDDDVFDQQLLKDKLSKTTPYANEDEAIHEPTFQKFSF
jgi:hypothetical protein